MIYKVGDKVIILSSAYNYGVPFCVLGQKGIIIKPIYSLYNGNFISTWYVRILNTNKYWCVRPQDIRLCRKDKQLLFSFMR